MSKPADQSWREFEHAGWERASAVYADTFEAVTRQFAAPLLDAAGAARGMDLLEVACGTGFVSSVAASRGARVTGVDFSASMIAEAAKRHPSLSFREADAEDLPFPDSTFDAVAVSFGVNHFPFPQRALSEARRVLRAGGRVAFTVWAPLKDNVLHRIIVDAVREAGDSRVFSLPLAPSGEVGEIATCQRLLREAGFDGPSLRAEVIEAFTSFDSAQKYIDMFTNGVVRMSAMIKAQPRERTPMILAAVERAVAPYRKDGRLTIPVSAILGAATRP